MCLKSDVISSLKETVQSYVECLQVLIESLSNLSEDSDRTVTAIIAGEQELQGRVTQYYIAYSNSPGVFQYESYPPNVENATISTLTPNSYYEFRVTIDNGAYNITSAPAYAETGDGGKYPLQR